MFYLKLYHCHKAKGVFWKLLQLDKTSGFVPVLWQHLELHLTLCGANLWPVSEAAFSKSNIMSTCGNETITWTVINSSLSFDTIQSTVIKMLHFLDIVFRTKMVTITQIKTEIKKCYIIKTQTVQIKCALLLLIQQILFSGIQHYI